MPLLRSHRIDFLVQALVSCLARAIKGSGGTTRPEALSDSSRTGGGGHFERISGPCRSHRSVRSGGGQARIPPGDRTDRLCGHRLPHGYGGSGVGGHEHQLGAREGGHRGDSGVAPLLGCVERQPGGPEAGRFGSREAPVHRPPAGGRVRRSLLVGPDADARAGNVCPPRLHPGSHGPLARAGHVQESAGARSGSA